MIENKLLLRQLKKAKIIDFDNVSKKQLEKLLLSVEASYTEVDHHTYRLERALKVSSEELRDFNDTLEEKVKIELSKNRQKDKQLLEQSRFAALGEMIGNIAHQWRQPLSAISSTASGMLLHKDLGISNEKTTYESFEKIITYVTFLNQTIEDFRGFFRKDKTILDLDLKEVLKHTLAITSASYNDNEISIIIEDNTNKELKSKIISSELSQVFLNILNNAKDALISNKIKDKIVHISYNIDEGNNVILIHDNAKGIPNAIIDKIYDPYFTTKHQSQGTGIGLYMSKEIVEKHLHGQLSVENSDFTCESGKHYGACFKITIPKIK